MHDNAGKYEQAGQMQKKAGTVRKMLTEMLQNTVHIIYPYQTSYHMSISYIQITYPDDICITYIHIVYAYHISRNSEESAGIAGISRNKQE